MNDRQNNPEIAKNPMQANEISLNHELTDRAPVPDTKLLQARILKIADGLPQQSTRLPTGRRRSPTLITAEFYANLLALTRPAVAAAALAILVMTSGGLYLSGYLFNSLPQSNNVEYSKTIGLEPDASNIVSRGEMVNRAEIDELQWQEILLMQDEIAFASL